MERSRLLELVAALEERFETLELRRPRELARNYARAVEGGHSLPPLHEVQVHPSGAWTAESVTRWMGMLRLPPYHERYPVQEKEAPCPICRRRDAVHPAGALAGGVLFRCAVDDKSWLCVD